MGLRDILDAATPGPWTWMGGYPQRITNPGAILIAETFTDPDSRAYNAELIALAPELAALCLRMGAWMRDVSEYVDSTVDIDHPLAVEYEELLAHLDRLGKEPSDG